ncbi:MAG: cation-efflux pump [Deltaproteobacteria bacterium]|jgi:cation diffusion facilitator family transporter|nr:cation-efflux pump [Deltaproteobacteria bacterium]
MPEQPHIKPRDAAEREKRRAAALSVAAAVFLTALKLGVGLAANSLAVLSEAVHSGLDLMASGLTYVAVRKAAVPADKGHPYGHGKIENLAALAETALLIAACVWITREAVDRLLVSPVRVTPSIWAVLVMAVSVIVDYARSRTLAKAAKEHRSQALEADAVHFSTDMLSSLVVLAGLGFLYLAQALPADSASRPWLEKADAFAALGVSCIVVKISWSLGRRAVNVLLDAGDMALAQDMRESLNGLSGVRSIESLRIRHSGPDLFVDLELAVDGALPIDEAEHLRAAVEQRVRGRAEYASVAVVLAAHRPEEEDRIARLRGLAAAHGLTVHAVEMLDLEAPETEKRQTLVELHTEFPPETPLEDAFGKVKALEESFRKTCPDASDVAMVSHIEPAGAMGRERLASPADSRWVLETVCRVVSEEHAASDAHNVLVRSLEGGRSASFHCRMAEKATVAEAHAIATRLQERLRRELPELDRVTVQMEP